MSLHARFAKRFAVFLVVLLSFGLVPLPAVFAATATATSYSLNEDTVKSIKLGGTASGRETLSFSISTQPTHGSVSLSGAMAVYTPAANYNGGDSFTFKATGSSSGTSSPATVSLSIAAVNDAPVASSAISLATDQNVAVTAQFGGTDVDGDSLKCYASSAMAGTFTMDANTCKGTYTPATNFVGTAYVTYKVYDGKVYSPSVTLPVTVRAVNYAPVAVNISRSLNEDTPTAINLQATDANNDAITYSIQAAPAHGTVTLSSYVATYTPSANYNGSDSFTYTASDASSTSNTATVSLTIAATNDAPTASPVNVVTGASTPATITFAGSDVDGDALTYGVVTQPLAGTISTVSGNQVTYTPTAGTRGTFSFNYSVSDGIRTVSSTVTITLNDLPVAHEITEELVEGSSAFITPVVTDTEGSSVTITLLSTPSHGTLQATSGAWTYTPAAGFVGVDTFTYGANDGVSDSLPGTIRLNVTAPTGLAQTPIVQLGVNFVYSIDDSVFSNLRELGAQAVRQLSEEDYTWPSVELSQDHYLDSSGTAGVRKTLNDQGILVVNTFNEAMFASPTPFWDDWSVDYSLFQHEVGTDFQDYLSHLLPYMTTSLPSGTVVVNESGNELFHWLPAYPELNFSVLEQAKMVGTTMTTTTSALEAAGYRVLNEAPSIMIESSLTWDWWNEFLADLDRTDVEGSSSDLDIENYHYYADPARYLSYRQSFEAAGEWKQGLLMNMTEFGFSDDPTTTRVDNANPVTKASRLVQTAAMAWGSGDSMLCYHSFWNAQDADNDLRGSGLINVADGSWTPAAYNYRLITQELLPFNQVVDLISSDWTQMEYQFRTDSGATKYVAWGSGNLVVPAGVTQMTSMYSTNGEFTWQAVVPGQALTLSDIPVMMK